MSLKGRFRTAYEVECLNPDFDCKDLTATGCVVYNGGQIHSLDIQDGDDLNHILQKIDSFAEGIISAKTLGFPIRNVGRGAQLWDGLNEELHGQIRTIVGSPSINIYEQEKEIKIEVNSDWLTQQMSSFQSSISNLTNTVAQSATTFSTMGMKVDDTVSEIETLQGSVEELRSHIEESDIIHDELQNALDGVVQLVNTFETRLGKLENIRIKVVGEYITVVNGEGRGMSSIRIRDIIQNSAEILPFWAVTGKVGCSIDENTYQKSIDGTFGFREYQDKNPKSFTFGEIRWVRDTTIDNRCGQ